MNVRFTTRDDGQVDARLGSQRVVFNEALADSISSLPPRGETGNGPSTYWIDVAEQGARQAIARGDGAPFLWGNCTVLRVRSGRVVAEYDYAPGEDPGEEMPLEEFLELLSEWRKRVIASRLRSNTPLPETYRRNPTA